MQGSGCALPPRGGAERTMMERKLKRSHDFSIPAGRKGALGSDMLMKKVVAAALRRQPVQKPLGLLRDEPATIRSPRDYSATC